jgi:hypothetical protein
MTTTTDTKTENKTEDKTDKEAKETPVPAATNDEPIAEAKVGARVAKKFFVKKSKRSTGKFYFGTLKEQWKDDDGKTLWTVVYDDDDTEDYDEKEVEEGLAMYASHKRLDYKTFGKPETKKRKKADPLPPPPPRTSKYPKRGETKN